MTGSIIVKCKICNRNCSNKLCDRHNKSYIWDSALKGYRLKKKNTGSRYTQADYHKTETIMVKLIEQLYGRPNVVTSFHPEWALSSKGVLLEYDIHIVGTNILIEYNGRQHYEYVKFFHKKICNFKKQINRDILKQKLAIVHGYRLIIIKHDEPITKQYIRKRISDN